MLKMRLQRTGRKNDPSFRVVVTDSRHGPKSGKHADTIGSYSPKFNRIEIDGARAKDWIAKGVQVSDTVRNLLITQGTLEGRKVKKEAEAAKAEEAEPPAEEAPAAEETPAAA